MRSPLTCTCKIGGLLPSCLCLSLNMPCNVYVLQAFLPHVSTKLQLFLLSMSVHVVTIFIKMSSLLLRSIHGIHSTVLFLDFASTVEI